MRHLVIEVSILEKSLRWNTAPVQASASGALHFDTSYFFTELSCTDSTYIACRASTDYYKIIHIDVSFGFWWITVLCSTSDDLQLRGFGEFINVQMLKISSFLRFGDPIK